MEKLEEVKFYDEYTGEPSYSFDKTEMGEKINEIVEWINTHEHQIDIDKILKQIGYGCAHCNDPDCEGNKNWLEELKLAIQDEKYKNNGTEHILCPKCKKGFPYGSVAIKIKERYFHENCILKEKVLRKK